MRKANGKWRMCVDYRALNTRTVRDRYPLPLIQSILSSFIGVLQEDEDVIDIHPYENPQVVSKNVIDDALECRWCIAEAEGHTDPFEGPKLRVEGNFFDIFVLDSNLVEPTDKVDL